MQPDCNLMIKTSFMIRLREILFSTRGNNYVAIEKNGSY